MKIIVALAILTATGWNGYIYQAWRDACVSEITAVSCRTEDGRVSLRPLPFEQLQRGVETAHATPVHHTGEANAAGVTPSMEAPAPDSDRARWMMLEKQGRAVLKNHPLGDPWHDKAQCSYDKIQQHLRVADYQHEKLEAGQAPASVDGAFDAMKTRPASCDYTPNERFSDEQEAESLGDSGRGRSESSKDYILRRR